MPPQSYGRLWTTRALGTQRRRGPRDPANQRLFRSAQDAGGASDAADAKFLGYERHHIVEQNDDNIAKIIFAKFGRPAIEDPSNIVYIPRLKHELISAEFSSEDADDTQGRIIRDVVDELDFEQQRAIGLDTLRKYGILQ